MRRTLAVLVTTTAFLVPAQAAMASSTGHDLDRPNASCNNGKGGNGAEFNGKGNSGNATGCTSELPVAPAPVGPDM